jgi:short-subunit dehydrogenase
MRERYGEWALVTGASAGIGREFAVALAAEGFSCVLAARRRDRLEALSAELEARHGVETRAVAVDLASADGPERLVDAVSDLEIGVLVNNAGFGYAGSFALQDTERLREMVMLNCVAPTVLTSRLLAGMRARGHGAVIMVGSVAGSQPLPLHAVYSATKAFDNLLGEALWGEMRGTGIDVLSLLPGSTASEFHDVAGELPHAGQPADEVVAVALGALGRQPSVMTTWFNWARANLASRLLPRSLLAAIARDVVAAQTPKDRR